MKKYWYSIGIISLALPRLIQAELQWDWRSIDTAKCSFPPSFMWGVATAAHQVEGNCTHNNWYAWEHGTDKNGKPHIKDGQTSGLACDHWNLYKHDIELIKKLGVKAYRFSIEWSKIEPEQGKFCLEALEHYTDVCRALVDAGIEPVVTLHHFTNPLWFEKLGAFEKEENIHYFVHFCTYIFKALHNYVTMWCTINEPAIYTFHGYVSGLFPPGKRDVQSAGTVLKNLLEAHTQVYRTLKQLPGGKQARIGFVKNLTQFDAYTPYHIIERLLCNKMNQLFNRSILTYLRTGIFKFKLPFLANIQYCNPLGCNSFDFIGLNYYAHWYLRVSLRPEEITGPNFRPNDIKTDMPTVFYPEGLYRAIQEVAQLNVPIYITENGIADAKDEKRELFLQRYLYALSKAISDGYDVRGYFYWSLMDNFEWSEGFAMRFGLYAVDYETQERKLRKGAHYLLEMVKKFSSLPTKGL